MCSGRRFESGQVHQESILCNCLVYVVWMKFRWGGKILIKKSRTWFGFHTTWVSPNGTEWEYTLAKPKKQPWYYVPVCYKGIVKRVSS